MSKIQTKIKTLKWGQVVLIVLIMSVVIPVLLGCLYAVTSVDDYEYATVWAHYKGGFFQYLIEEFSREYMTWQGNYLAVIATKMPIIHYGGVAGLRIYLLIVSVLFFVTAIVFARTFVSFSRIPAESRVSTLLILLTAGFFYLLGANYLSELFYWFCGLQTYTMPLCFIFISLSCYMLYQMKNQKRYIIIGSVCAFLGAGAALNVVAFFCAVLLFGVLYNLIILRKTDKSIIMGVVALIGALINATAPGNFARHAHFESGIGIGKAMVYTAIRLVNVLYGELRSGILLLAIVPAFYVGYKYLVHGALQIKITLYVTLYTVCAVFITDFPVVLGYSDTIIGVRGDFVEHLSITVFFSFMFMYWGAWFAGKEILNFTPTSLFMLGAVFVLFLTGPYVPGAAKKFTPYKMIVHMLNGDFKEISEKEESIIRQIEESTSPNPTVRIAADREGQWTNIARNYVPENNIITKEMGMCRYFGKDSVTIEYYRYE